MLESALTDPSIVLELDEVSKKFFYNLSYTRKWGFREIIRAGFGKDQQNGDLRKSEFWAVRNVSFQLQRGKTLGIIGLNGSGKSTILKMINGLYMPDQGQIRIKGNVGALIELGTGFHPMLTGRENIYIKGALLGKSKEEMDEIYQQIADFAELGEFINSPIKTYSSGMHVRLGFAVAVHIDPDILLMDEVLSVGDFQFRQKCMDKINYLRERTSTIFVSHSMGDISLFCDWVIVLDKGMIAFEGKADDAIKFYMYDVEEKNNKKKQPVKQKTQDIKPFYGDLFINEKKICDIEHYWADKDLKKIDHAETGSEVNIVIKFRLKRKPRKDLVVGIPIWDKKGTLITGIATDMDQIELVGDNENRYELILHFKELSFNPNEYVSTMAVVDGLEYYYRGINNTLAVTNYKRNFGFFTANHRWIIGTTQKSSK
jgi:ABC-type polysaccharide/polyol phosphate transport system ATPase subunit